MAQLEPFTFETISALAAPADETKRRLIEETLKAHEYDLILAATSMEYFAQFIQTSDEETEAARPYPTRTFYPTIWEVNDQIEKHRRVIIHKARRVMVSWTGMLRQLWRSWRVGLKIPGCPRVFKGGVMTVGEDESKELIGRQVEMYESLPNWLRDVNPLHNTTTKITFQLGGESTGFPLTRRGPRTFGFTEVFFDEMAFQEAVRATWRGMIPTLGGRGIIIAVSTPNGRFNLFHDVWTNKGGRYSDFHRIWIPHHAHPEHQESWLGRQVASMSQKDVAREYFGSFSQGEGDPVWEQFKHAWHVWDPEKGDEPVVEISRPVYIGYDLGFHFPAATVWQRNHRDQWLGILEYQDYDCDFEAFCLNLREKIGALYDRRKALEIHCMPPDAKNRYHQRARSGAANDVAQVKLTFAFGNRPPQVRFCPPEVGKRTNEAPRLKVMRSLFKRRADDCFGIVVHPRMEMFIDGCAGGYTYAEKGGEQPADNEYTHLQDSAQSVFAACPIQFPEPPRRQQNNPNAFRQRIGHGTGL